MSAGRQPESRPDDSQVEPLYTALGQGDHPRTSAKRPSLYWKLFWATLVVIALLLLVLKQAF